MHLEAIVYLAIMAALISWKYPSQTGLLTPPGGHPGVPSYLKLDSQARNLPEDLNNYVSTLNERLFCIKLTWKYFVRKKTKFC